MAGLGMARHGVARQGFLRKQGMYE